ncbi:MAG TPA: hypothetical protein VEQ34_11390, partial [Pyrinomonadaceae bacterium]|nr:hypothetical protein [Pyrinomonadaceae bacterium]
RTFVGRGKPGNENSLKASFYEPGGISAANGKLFVSDTNNHSIRIVDLKTRAVSTLKINGLQSPQNNHKSKAAKLLTVNNQLSTILQ